MIFITLGSQKFQFNRILEEIDKLVKDNVINDEVFAQIGESTYNPNNFSYCKFLNRDEFIENLKKSNIVITHGGTGVIINAIKYGNKVIAVPRLKEYGEHVDNHQMQLVKEFEKMGIIEACYDIKQLKEKYEKVQISQYKQYKSNTNMIINDIEEFLEKI